MNLDFFNWSPPIWQNVLLLISILVTGLFSFLVLRISKETKEISNNMKVIEEQRDAEKNIKSSVIVYYDIKTMIEYLAEAITSLERGSDEFNQSKILINEMWIQHLAVLRKVLNRVEIDYIRNLFNDVSNLNLKVTGDTKKNDLEKIINKYLLTELLNNINLKQTKIQPFEIINYDLYIILSKIYLETLNENELYKQRIKKKKGLDFIIKIMGNYYYRGNRKEIFEGSFSIYDEMSDRLKMKGRLENGKFSGYYYGYDDKLDLYIFEYFHGDIVKKKIINNNYIDYSDVILDESLNSGEWEGVSTDFYKKSRFKKVKSHGNYKDNKLHGYGYEQKNGIVRKGFWENGVFLNGDLIESKKVVFSGQFRNGMPYSGTATKYNFDEVVKGFSGELREGKPFNGEGMEFLTNKAGHTVGDLNWFKEMDEYMIKTEIEQQNDEGYLNWEEEGFKEQERMLNKYWATYTNAKWKDGVVIEKGKEGVEDSYQKSNYEQYWSYLK